MRLKLLIIVMLVVVSKSAGQEISVTGTVKDSEGNSIANALVRFDNLGYVAVTSTSGGFTISNSSPVQPRRTALPKLSALRVERGSLFFTVNTGEPVFLDIFTLGGKLCTRKRLDGLETGSYSVLLSGIIPPELGSGTYIVSSRIGSGRVAARVTHGAARRGGAALRRIDTQSRNIRVAGRQDVLDMVTVSKLGYESQSIPVENYSQNLGDIVLVKSSALDNAASIAAIEDSLFEVLIARIEQMGEIEGPSELKSIDFISLRNGFEAILEKGASRVKSNVGYMLSAITSINSNPKIWKLADSLDAYMEAMFEDDEDFYLAPAVKPSGLMKRAMKKGGVIALGKALFAGTPRTLLALTDKPSFPKFYTISYIQNLIETDLLPILDPVQQAAARIEALTDGSMTVMYDGEEYEIDKGEVYLFDGMVSLVRACLYMYCAYDFDVLTSAEHQDYSWIDSMDLKQTSSWVYRISGDTLRYVCSDGLSSDAVEAMASALRYNLEERPSFLTIRRNYHEGAIANLRAVPAKVKSGLAAIRSETDDQENDLLRLADIDEADDDMLDLSAEMTEEGISSAFAQNFSSIDKLVDFIDALLAGPYNFDETINGVQLTFTVNISAWFENPVTDLRTLLPRYVWTDPMELHYTNISVEEFYYTEFKYNPTTESYDTLYLIYAWDDDSVDVDESLIDSIVEDGSSRKYYINRPLHYMATIDSTYSSIPIRFADASGTAISDETMEELIDNGQFFPYFNDYSIGGLLPGMTRDKWLDIVRAFHDDDE